MTLRRTFGISFTAILLLIATQVFVQLWVERRRAVAIDHLESTLPAESATQLAPLRERETGRILLSLHGVAALVVVVAATAGLRRLAGGFVALRRGAAALADEDLHALIPLDSKDEFGELAEVVNTLAYDLALTQRHLTVANRQLARRNQEIEEQRRISDSLLRNILPGQVADELSAEGKVEPKAFEDVTILFTDFVGFTRSTEHMPAQDLVEILHDYFTDFDRIVRRYRLEKLKTIGDSYMCAGGLPTRSASHPVDTVLAAFEMLHAVEQRGSVLRSGGWTVRIGIHTGAVIAGVVGIDKFAFDVWGETVNFSSRVEATGAPNRINISAATHARTRDFFEFESRGKVRTKEDRDFDMYFVTGPRPDLVGVRPNLLPPPFMRQYRGRFGADPPAFPPFFDGGGRNS